MAYLVQEFVKNHLLLLLTIIVCCLHVTAARAVQLKHTRPTVKRGSMPDGLHITLTGETGTSGDVKLQLLQHSVPDVPVYTLGVDESGQHFTHPEKLEFNPNVAFYHDLNNNAVMQVSRTAGRGDREVHYELEGDLAIEGNKYTLISNIRFQRESSSPSKAESYTLVPQEPLRFARHDHLSAPSQVRLQVVEAAREMSPDLGYILAEENVQRRQAKRVKSVIIDVVAVADYAIYRRFLARSRSPKQALKAIRLYYAFIFSGVDLLYKSIRHTQYPITVLLVKVVISETAASSQFTEKFRMTNLNQTNVDKVIEAFKLFSQRTRNGLKPHDHAMLFSGYDLATVKKAGKVRTGTTGRAFMSTLCKRDGTSTSIIEDLGVIQSVTATAAHELGHSLGSEHDEVKNTCPEDDGFIMSAVELDGSPIKYESWLFSSCSINYFMSYITKTLKTRFVGALYQFTVFYTEGYKIWALMD